MTIQENIPLAPHTTFKIGGPARFFVRVQTVGELREALEFARQKQLSVFVLGGGSNILVADAGFSGLVIKVELRGIERTGNTLVAAAGESWDGLVARAVEEGLWGVENLSGIPGTVGGAVVQGVGAYGAAVGETLQWVEVLDTQTGEVKKMTAAECQFDYRDSFFKHDGGRNVVLRAAFALRRDGTPNASYRDLADTARFNLAQVRERVLFIRAGKFPDLAQEGTAGSFFKNPILSRDEALELQKTYPDMPLFEMPETKGIKVPLAWLLDKALGLKGTAVGGARLYEKQPLVIAVARSTKATDVQKLVSLVKDSVQKKLNIEIKAEVKVI